jgi:hypothetical protein
MLGVTAERPVEVELLERAPTQEMPQRFQEQGIREAGEAAYRIVKER